MFHSPLCRDCSHLTSTAFQLRSRALLSLEMWRTAAQNSQKRRHDTSIAEDFKRGKKLQFVFFALVNYKQLHVLSRRLIAKVHCLHNQVSVGGSEL